MDWPGLTLIPDLDCQRPVNNRLSHETAEKNSVGCTILLFMQILLCVSVHA